MAQSGAVGHGGEQCFFACQYTMSEPAVSATTNYVVADRANHRTRRRDCPASCSRVAVPWSRCEIRTDAQFVNESV